MRIGKINTGNFKGLWQLPPEEERVGYNFKDGAVTPIYARVAAYRPFKDENKSETKEAILKAEKTGYFACYSGDNKELIGYLMHLPIIGKKLQITKEQYEELKSLQETNTPAPSEDLIFERQEPIR